MSCFYCWFLTLIRWKGSTITTSSPFHLWQPLFIVSLLYSHRFHSHVVVTLCRIALLFLPSLLSWIHSRLFPSLWTFVLLGMVSGWVLNTCLKRGKNKTSTKSFEKSRNHAIIMHRDKSLSPFLLESAVVETHREPKLILLNWLLWKHKTVATLKPIWGVPLFLRNINEGGTTLRRPFRMSFLFCQKEEEWCFIWLADRLVVGSQQLPHSKLDSTNYSYQTGWFGREMMSQASADSQPICLWDRTEVHRKSGWEIRRDGRWRMALLWRDFSLCKKSLLKRRTKNVHSSG